MSDFEPITDLRGHSEGAELPQNALETDPSRPIREGLPRGYRMRADSHYLDDVMGQVAAQPVRLIPTKQLSSKALPDQTSLRPLVESIRVHGIVQPLLVRRTDSGYQTIAGHKRLAAAHVLQLPTVPCFVHNVDEAYAVQLERAENLRVVSAPMSDTRAVMIAGLRRAISQHLTIVHANAEAITTCAGPVVRLSADLIASNSWRMARLLDITRALTEPVRVGRMRALASVGEQVVDGFAAESRLNGIVVATHTDAVAGVPVPEHETLVLLAASVLATIPLISEISERATITIGGTPSNGNFARITVSQDAVPVSSDFAGRFFDPAWAERPGGWAATGCAVAVHSIAERLGGSVRFEAGPQRAAGIEIDLPASQ